MPSALLRPLALLLLTAALTACTDDGAETDVTETPAAPAAPVVTNDLVAAAEEEGLTRLTALAEAAGLTSTLRGEGPYTVFAPTNEAFEALPRATLDSLTLPANRDRLARLLRYHVVPGRIETNMLPITVRTLEGAELTVEADADGFVARDARGGAVNVVTPDVNVTNGVVHVVDAVLMPPPQDGR